jgi:hypothetical protein
MIFLIRTRKSSFEIVTKPARLQHLDGGRHQCALRPAYPGAPRQPASPLGEHGRLQAEQTQ